MICWQCSSELVLVFEADDFSSKLYHCDGCGRWFEMKKEKVRVNGAVPVSFLEMENAPELAESGNFLPGGIRTKLSRIF